MAMTEEERRRARNEASKRWYAAHKAAKKTAAPKEGAKQKQTKKVEAKPARAAKPAKKVPGQDIQKRIDKLVKKNERIVSAAGILLKEAAAILADMYKTGDQKLIDKTTKLFAKKLSIAVEAADDGHMVAKLDGAKTFRVPKTVVDEPAPSTPDTGDEKPVEEPKEISVDPSLLTGVEDGTITKSDIEAPAADDEDPDLDEDEDEDENEDEDEEKDPEDMDDEEYARYRERQAEKETDEFFEGRAEAMRELEEQGAFED